MKFTLTLDQSSVQKTYQTVLAETAKQTTVKGFRPGKAPLKVVEANLDQAKLYEQVLNRLLPSAYSSYIKKHKLHPITMPRIKLKEAKADTDWIIEIEIAEKPTVKLGDYETVISQSQKTQKIHLPGAEPDKPETETERLNRIFDLLLKTCSLTVPDLLIDEETDRRLSNLLYQIEKLGISLDAYTASINKSTEAIKTEYRQDATASLKLEFILDAIATSKHLEATETEINEFIEKIDDLKMKAAIQTDPEKRQNLSVALTKRKVTDYLINLTASPIILSK